MQERGILADSTMYNVLVLCCTWLGFILSYTAKNRHAERNRTCASNKNVRQMPAHVGGEAQTHACKTHSERQ